MSLLTDGTNYFLQPNGGAAVELSYNGAPVFAGEFAQYGYNAPIAATQTASGYEVAWKTTSGDQYQIWNTDSSGIDTFPSPSFSLRIERPGRDLTSPVSIMTLNGDGTIGVPPPPPPAAFLDRDRVVGLDELADRRDQLFSSAERRAAVELSYHGAPVLCRRICSVWL